MYTAKHSVHGKEDGQCSQPVCLHRRKKFEFSCGASLPSHRGCRATAQQRKRKNKMKTQLETLTTESKPEPMAVRVALHPFLAGMNRTNLSLLTDCAIAVSFKKGQIILREGDLANRFYLIESGEVVLESGRDFGKPVIVDRIGAGDLLGCDERAADRGRARHSSGVRDVRRGRKWYVKERLT